MSIKGIVYAPMRIIKFIINKSRYGSISWRTYIERPLRIEHKKNIYLGANVCIASYCWLSANPKVAGIRDAKLIIGDGCAIGDYAHIYATKEIQLEKYVLLANYVYITDNLHGYEDINVPVIKQPIVQKQPVHIGEGSWIGEHACIIGASIGKHCVIGANSVVTHDVPDYCIAVGAPARVIKRYNFDAQKWEKV